MKSTTPLTLNTFRPEAEAIAEAVHPDGPTSFVHTVQQRPSTTNLDILELRQ